MGRTYDIVCHDCEVKLWIGQRGAGSPEEKAYIYGTDESLKQQRDFFFSHQNHRLEFGDSEPFAAKLDYQRLDSED